MTADISVVGVEISEDVVYIAQVYSENNQIYIEKLLSFELPSKLVVDCKILDVDVFVEKLREVITKNELNVQQMVLGFRSLIYYQSVEKFSEASWTGVDNFVSLKMEQLLEFSSKPFVYGYQFLDIETVDDENYRYLYYCVFSKAIFEFYYELVQNVMGYQLLGTDMSVMAAFRAITYQKNIEPMIFVYVDTQMVHVIIQGDGDVFLSKSFSVFVTDWFHDEITISSLNKRILRFFMSFYDIYSFATLPVSVTFFSRLNTCEVFLGFFKKSFPEFNVTFFDGLDQNIFHFNDQSLLEKENMYSSYLSVIGYTLKVFCKRSEMINFVEVKQKLSPLIKPKVLISNVLVGVIFILIMFGVNIYFSRHLKEVNLDIDQLSQKIALYQKGSDLLDTRKKKIVELNGLLESYKGLIDNRYTKIDFLEKVVSGLPDDVVFKTINISDDQHIVIDGSTYFEESIYVFYLHIQSLFKNVVIGDIKNRYDSDDRAISSFRISFSW